MVDVPSHDSQVIVEFDHVPELSSVKSVLSASEECKDISSTMDHPEVMDEANADIHVSEGVLGRDSTPSARLAKIKKEHDIAKAVKSDDAEVPVHLWDEIICRGTPSDREREALVTLRKFGLRLYRRMFLKD